MGALGGGLSRAPTQMPLWFRLIIGLTGHSQALIQFYVDFMLWKNTRPDLQWGRTFYWKAPQLTKYTVCFAPSCVPRPLACVAKVCGGNPNTEKLSLEFQLIFCTILIMQAQGTQANSQLPNPGGVLYCKGGRHSLPRQPQTIISKNIVTLRAFSSRPASALYLQQVLKYMGLGCLKEIWIREGNKCFGGRDLGSHSCYTFEKLHDFGR